MAALAQAAGCASGADAALRSTTYEVLVARPAGGPDAGAPDEAAVGSAGLVLGPWRDPAGFELVEPRWLDARAFERAVRAALPTELAAAAALTAVAGGDPRWWAPVEGNATAVAHRHEPDGAQAGFSVELGARVRPWSGAGRADDLPPAGPRSTWRLEVQSLARWPRAAWSSDNDRHLEAARAAHEALVEHALRELERACAATGLRAERGPGGSTVLLLPGGD